MGKTMISTAFGVMAGIFTFIIIAFVVGMSMVILQGESTDNNQNTALFEIFPLVSCMFMALLPPVASSIASVFTLNFLNKMGRDNR